MDPMSRDQGRQLAGRILKLPETPWRTELRLKIIRVEFDPADPDRMVVHGIRVNGAGREFEGRRILLTPAGLGRYLQ